MPKTVGIDLGTTNSVVAVLEGGESTVIPNAEGSRLTPSVVGFTKNGERLVGSSAKRQAVVNPERTIISIKRRMGTSDKVTIDDRSYTPEEISAMIIQKLKADAEAYLGDKVDSAVITVPAYFNDAQRTATKNAGEIAGLKVLRIINEPTAAALAYGLDRRRNGTVAVYDLGGGTFDCSILSISDGVFKVLSTNGDTHLGGDDFDRALMEVAAREMGVDLSRKDPELLQHLRDQGERVKIALSDAETAVFRIDLPARGLRFERTFTRAELEKLLEPFIDRTIDRCRSALRDAEKSPREIHEVVLVGGSTRIPYVRRRVEEFFGRKPHTELNPDEVVAMGAAVQADILTGGRRHMLLLDVVPLSLGIETLGGAVSKLIHRNSTIPARATERFTTFVDGQTSVDINIYQGERELAKDCRSLGRFRLSGIPPMPAQLPQIDVTFLIDANGLLTVSAREQRSGKEAKVTVQPSHGLTNEEVERLVLESVEHAREDFHARRLVELKNKAQIDLRHTEKGLASEGEHLSAEQRQRIDAAIRRVRGTLETTNPDELHRALDELNTATLPLAERLMNAVVRSTLKDRKMEEVDAEKL
jgi:molecular chaperone DnaK